MMEIKNISKSYGEKRVLENVSLVIDDGEAVVISGLSGRGKTTFLRILMGLIKPDGGEIIGAPEKISAVFQEDRLPNEFSVLNCVRMTAPRGVGKEIIAEHLTELGLADYVAKPVSELSGGMKRRVAICRAVLAAADTVYMDEPFTGLDLETKIKVIEYIKKHCVGKTLVVVSHNDEDAELLSAKKIRL